MLLKLHASNSAIRTGSGVFAINPAFERAGSASAAIGTVEKMAKATLRVRDRDSLTA
jgi:hypothetical protein